MLYSQMMPSKTPLQRGKQMVEAINQASKVVEDKILHILSHFPKVTPSMMQISLGSSIPTELWHSVLDKLVEESTVHRYKRLVTAPNGRTQTQTILSLEPPGEDEYLVAPEVASVS
jgi:hypothetical protein